LRKSDAFWSQAGGTRRDEIFARPRFNFISEEWDSLNVLNRLWFDKRDRLIPDYVALVEENYRAVVETVDFLNNRESTRVEIND